jgi:hypothetical protein
VGYQGRKKAKTSNILPLTDGNGFILASTGILAGNQNDSFNLKSHLQAAFKSLKRLNLSIGCAILYCCCKSDVIMTHALESPAGLTK